MYCLDRPSNCALLRACLRRSNPLTRPSKAWMDWSESLTHEVTTSTPERTNPVAWMSIFPKNRVALWIEIQHIDHRPRLRLGGYCGNPGLTEKDGYVLRTTNRRLAQTKAQAVLGQYEAESGMDDRIRKLDQPATAWMGPSRAARRRRHKLSELENFTQSTHPHTRTGERLREQMHTNSLLLQLKDGMDVWTGPKIMLHKAKWRS
jgi:hypothetical protein